MLQQIVSLWIGSALGKIERLSLRSFVAQGHPVALYSYGGVAGVPAGVEQRDASQVLPRDVAERNFERSGSHTLSADMFRLQLQRLGLGLWVDVDVVALRPVDIEGDFVAGRESDRYINNAVLRLAPDSALLIDWIAQMQSGRVPRWLPFHRAPTAYVGEMLGRTIEPSALPFGTFGPKAITALAERHGITEAAQAREVFYPLHPRDAERLFDPTLNLDDVVASNSRTIHLWNEKLGPLKKTEPPEGSILARLLRFYPEGRGTGPIQDPAP
jgi:hypothetical protein